MRDRNIVVALLVILVAATLFRLYCMKGFAGFDDAEYARFAHQVLTGDFRVGSYTGPAVFPLRVGVIYPAALAFRVFGINQGGLVIFPFLLSIASALLLFACTAHFFDRRAGIVAALLWAVLPADIEYNATKLLPDLPAAFFATLGIAILLVVRRRNPRDSRVLALGGLLGGASFGFSWLCKETTLFYLPFLLILFCLDAREDLKSSLFLWSGVALGSLGILLTEMAVYRHLTGDWLFRFHEVERNYRQLSNGFFTEGSKFGWAAGESRAKALAKRLFLQGPGTILLNAEFLYLPLTGLLGAAYAAYWKDRRFLVPSLWLVTLCLMFNFSSSSLTSYMPLALYERYLYPIYFPAVVMTSGFLMKLTAWGESRNPDESVERHREKLFWGVVLVLFLGVGGSHHVFQLIRAQGRSHAWMEGVRKASVLIPEGSRIYADPIGMRGLSFFRGYRDGDLVTNFEGMVSANVPPKSYVLTNRAYLDWLDLNAGMWLSDPTGYRRPGFFPHPPASWTVIWQGAGATLYGVP